MPVAVITYMPVIAQHNKKKGNPPVGSQPVFPDQCQDQEQQLPLVAIP
jgi:hypothetical protein